MLAKTFKGGKTYDGAVTTINYLLNERVATGTSRVMAGDSEITLVLIKEASKKQKWSWSSGVLTFSEKLTEQTKLDIMLDFEKVFFPSFDPSRYNILWVNHEDKGRSELHYVSPRIELSTGKSFNPYFARSDFTKKDLWQELVNNQYGLSTHLNKPKAGRNKKVFSAPEAQLQLTQILEKQTLDNQKKYGYGIKPEPLPNKNNHSKKYQTKKGSKNDSTRTSIDKLLGRDQEEARRRKIRITKITGNTRKLFDFIKRATDQNYRVIGESLRAWWKERQYQIVTETILKSIGQAAQSVGSWAACRHTEIQRGFTERDTAIQRSFSKRNQGITQLIQLKFSGEQKLVTMQKIKNARSRRRKSNPLGDINKTILPKNG